jgi:hypothetical protein
MSLFSLKSIYIYRFKIKIQKVPISLIFGSFFIKDKYIKNKLNYKYIKIVDVAD